VVRRDDGVEVVVNQQTKDRESDDKIKVEVCVSEKNTKFKRES
jgi:hypothetical protein